MKNNWDIFQDWLSDQGILPAFKQNHNGNVASIPNWYLTCSFTWVDTLEGKLFWELENKKWERYCEEHELV